MSSPTDKFCLRWNDFESNISSAFKELREDKDFFDVTLACEDDQLQAHKVILSACSDYFRDVFRVSEKICSMREVPRRARYNIAANGSILVRNLHQDRAIYGNVISRSTRHLPH